MSEVKPFKSIDEQIEILINRNLRVDDMNYARRVLSQISYYRLSGYTLTLRKNDVFYSGTTLDKIMDIYNFDSELRALLLHMIACIEVSFRTQIANLHAEKFGPVGYLDGSGFTSKQYFQDFILKVQDVTDITKNPSEVFVIHHHERYNGYFPFWVVMELLPFSWISKLFSNLDEQYKDEISQLFYQTNYKYVQNWLRGLSELRNICAHCGRLYNRILTYKPRLSSRDTLALNADRQKYKIFSYIYICKKLVLDPAIWIEFRHKLILLIEKYPFVHLKFYGFDDNWIDLLNK